MSYRSAIFAFAALTAAPAIASAHLEITAPTPRVQADNIKEAQAPCGGPRGGTIHQLTGGETMTIEYDETVAHPGFFQLRFSMAGDTNWMMLADQIPDQGGVGSYTYDFQVPDVTCDDCTLQFIQVMTDRNPPTNYYSCIDVEITASNAPANNGTPDVGVDEPDMGAMPPDMGTMPPDMESMPTNNGVGPTPGTTTGTGDPRTPDGTAGPGATEDPGERVKATGTCAAAAGGALPMPLLLLFGLFVTRGVGRRPSRGSTAAR